MALEFAILGFLNYQPYSGYDLKKIFDDSVQHFWPADQGQIYRTLARMTQQGWVKKETIPQESRPDRKVYHITDEGRIELHKWLAGPAPASPNRSAPLIQVFFAGQLSDDVILAKFEEHAAYIRQILAIYEIIPRQLTPYQKEIQSPREHFFWLLTLENGIVSARANLAWAESVIERIKNGQIPPT
jgi:DNA-binding PadR family transcriptional regulator